MRAHSNSNVMHLYKQWDIYEYKHIYCDFNFYLYHFMQCYYVIHKRNF